MCLGELWWVLTLRGKGYLTSFAKITLTLVPLIISLIKVITAFWHPVPQHLWWCRLMTFCMAFFIKIFNSFSFLLAYRYIVKTGITYLTGFVLWDVHLQPGDPCGKRVRHWEPWGIESSISVGRLLIQMAIFKSTQLEPLRSLDEKTFP